MAAMTYNELVLRYGRNMAFDLLITIEKMARIRDRMTALDEETRLKRALDELDRIDSAA